MVFLCSCLCFFVVILLWFYCLHLIGNLLYKKKPRGIRGMRFHIVNDKLVTKEEMKKPIHDSGMEEEEGDHETVQDGSKKDIDENEIKQER